MKNKLFPLVTTGTLLLSSVPAFAATNIQDITDVNVDSSAIGTMVIQDASQTAINGTDVSISKGNRTGISDSAIGIFVKDTTDMTQILGENIDISKIDISKITDTAINTWIEQKTERLTVQEK